MLLLYYHSYPNYNITSIVLYISYSTYMYNVKSVVDDVMRIYLVRNALDDVDELNVD